MPLKAVLFDMFDTLMLIERNHEFYHPSLMRMYRYLVDKGINVSFEKFNNTYIKVRDELFKKANPNWEEPHFNVRISETLKVLGFDYDVSSNMVAEATNEFCEEFMKFVLIDQDAKPTLEKLRKKYRLGIISNFAIPECVIKLLRNNDIEKQFDAIVISGAINKRKPSEEIFKSALMLMNLSPSEVIFVGDTIDADIEGAKAVGIKAIYIERRPQKQSEKFCPDKTIKSLRELPELIDCF